MKTDSKLPRGAVLISPPEKREIAGWAEMKYDARCVRYGITWLRVKDGIGGRGDREDWVADLPAMTVSVHDYHFHAPYWGIERYPSFNAAIKGQIKRAVGYARQQADEYTRKTAALVRTAKILKSALRKSP
jgi:hypothetical protein